MSESSSGRPGNKERGPEEVYCRHCGAVISKRAEICPECGVRQFDPPQSSVDSAVDELVQGGNPFVAAVLSALFPGLGQIYNRELEKGIAFIVGSFLAAVSAFVLIGFILFPLVWLFAIYDAYTVAERQQAAAAAASDTTEAGGAKQAASSARRRGTADSGEEDSRTTEEDADTADTADGKIDGTT